MVPHPQLTAMIVWSIGHLLMNGDVASLILFGGLLAWAGVQLALIVKQDEAPDKTRARGVYG